MILDGIGRNDALEPSMLLRLPKELRLLIFEFLFADNEYIVVGQPSQNPWKGKPCSYHPPVARASLQLRSEALSLLYRKEHVVLILRYCEGRMQIQEWLRFVANNPVLCKHIRSASIQYLERRHRSTALRVDTREFCVLNRTSWLHPLSLRPLPLLHEIEFVLYNFGQANERSARTVPDLLHQLISVMTTLLNDSRVLRNERLANLRVHGYTDFPLLTELMGILYHDSY